MRVFSLCLLLGLLSADHRVRALSNSTWDEIPETYANVTGGDAFWTSLFRNCKRLTAPCIQKTVYRYLNDTLDYNKDIQFAGLVKLTKNDLDFGKVKHELAMLSNETENEAESRDSGDSPSGESARALRKKMVKFVMTHDVEVQLPELLFDGAVFRISPRSLSRNGAMVKLDLLPKHLSNSNGEARIFFKKLKEFIGEKLLMALLAILLVIKLLSAKFLFFLPMVMGVAAAKKLLIKMVLFVFPFLHHVFKLCAYVPHGTKYHHHQHYIKHYHDVAHGGPHHHGGIEVIAPHAGGPPSLHHHLDHEHKDQHHHYNPHEDDLQYYSNGPSYTNEFITHRKEDKNNQVEDENNVYPWSAGQGQSSTRPKNPSGNRHLTPTEIEAMVMKAEKEALLKSRLQQEQLKVQAENLRLQEQIRKALKLQEKLKTQSMVINTYLKPPGLSTLPVQQNQLSQTNPFLQKPAGQSPIQITQPSVQVTTVIQTTTPRLPLYDSFYSPILEKIDKVLNGLGFAEEPCRERLICSMYKNPTKFSPHSNLVSAELSRDANELQKPTSSNLAVIRFYKYVQAARDGQDKRDCLRLYPSCSVNTEK